MRRRPTRTADTTPAENHRLLLAGACVVGGVAWTLGRRRSANGAGPTGLPAAVVGAACVVAVCLPDVTSAAKVSHLAMMAQLVVLMLIGPAVIASAVRPHLDVPGSRRPGRGLLGSPGLRRGDGPVAPAIRCGRRDGHDASGSRLGHGRGAVDGGPARLASGRHRRAAAGCVRHRHLGRAHRPCPADQRPASASATRARTG